MKCKDYNLIIWKKQSRPKKKIDKVRTVVGLDTETIKGKCWLISDSNGNYKETKTFNECVDFLTRESIRLTLNFFYNIQYDIQAIFKYLPRTILRELHDFGKAEVNRVRIRYIPRKYLSLGKGKNVYTFYDLWQFYRLSLDEASKSYLGRSKSDINSDDLGTQKYVNENKDKIIEYCINDSQLVQELAVKLQNNFAKVGISFVKPYSQAFISAKFFQLNCNIPIFYNKAYQRYAYKTYSGGRFELFRKGYFDDMYSYDIKMAYSYEISNLLDLSKGQWCKNTKIFDDFVYGFLRCKYECDNKDIAVKTFTRNGLNVYPRTSKKEIYITLNEYNYIKEHKLGKIKLLDGWFWYPEEEVKLFDKVKDIFRERERIRKEQPEIADTYKKLLNSLYGKFFQLIPKWEKLGDREWHDNVKYVGKKGFEELYIRRWITGNLFCPVYATIITSNTRLRVLDMVRENYDTAIATFTDSFLSTEKLNIKGSNLGEWDKDKHGELILVGTGIYSIRDGNDILTRSRGFVLPKDHDLFSFFENNRNKKVIRTDTKRVVSLGIYLSQIHQWDEIDFNNFCDFHKEININMDRKRTWEREFSNCNDVLHNNMASTTLSIP